MNSQMLNYSAVKTKQGRPGNYQGGHEC